MQLLCPVCGLELNKNERTWRCPNNHCFDEARQGYVNLLTVDRKHAKHPGDTKEQVAALPFPDHSFDGVLSMFALTVEQEFARVLAKNGWYLQVIAGPEHLMGLKSLIYPEILRKEKTLHPEFAGFHLERTETLEFSFTVDSAAQVQNLLSMTPHFWRISKEGAARLAATESLTDTAQVIFNLYRKEDSHAG